VELQSRAEHLKGQIRKIEAKEKRLLELFLDDDLAQTEQARVKLKEFAGERGRLTEALQRVEEQLADHALLSRAPDVEALCEQARRGLDQLDEEGRRGLLQDLGSDIKVRREGRQPRGHVHLEEDGGDLDPAERGGADPREHGPSVGTPPGPVNVPDCIPAGTAGAGPCRRAGGPASARRVSGSARYG
jgi:hypothetical protein